MTDQEQFIRDYSSAVMAGDAAVFIGAGLSRKAGYEGWPELLRCLANDIELDVEKEKGDLISLAQYYVNKKQRNQLDSAIRNFFDEKKDIVPTEDHLLLSALPIKSYWTTNYDRLLEQTFSLRKITYRALFSDQCLSVGTNNAQVLIHKMHGDVETPQKTIITKKDYELYSDTHEMMLSKFKGEMCSKIFLFLGYSFGDPNIHHILARIRKVFNTHAKQHYCIMRRVPKKENGKKTKDYEYRLAKQNHQVLDFKNYGVNVLLVDDRREVTKILTEIKRRVFMKNILICGAYEDDTQNKSQIAQFATNLAAWLIERGFKIYSGFGKNLGGHIVRGAFDGCTLGAGKDFNKSMFLFPFPYNVELTPEQQKDYYTRLRKNMIVNTHITIIICGEKIKDGKLIPSPGVFEEVQISKEQGNIIIPIGATGGAADKIWTEMSDVKNMKFKNEFKKLNLPWTEYDKIYKAVQNILSQYTA